MTGPSEVLLSGDIAATLHDSSNLRLPLSTGDAVVVVVVANVESFIVVAGGLSFVVFKSSKDTLRVEDELPKSSVMATAAMIARRSSDFSAPSLVGEMVFFVFKADAAS